MFTTRKDGVGKWLYGIRGGSLHESLGCCSDDSDTAAKASLMSRRGANSMQVITCLPDFEPRSNGYDCNVAPISLTAAPCGLSRASSSSSTCEPLGGATSPTFPLPTPGLQGFVPKTVQWHEVAPPAGVIDRVFGNYELMSQALPSWSERSLQMIPVS